ncbi:MAG TPA: DUF3410 domain-containing protein, partial [Fibrobacteraceae bacterium]|nr:DUF3410 domain-containing protein [Fibrobacteraceae bacterium]
PLEGKTLGIIGVGAVGSRVAAAATALGMRTLLNDPPRAAKEGRKRFDSLRNLQTQSDFLTIHTPLEMTGRHPTYRLINGDFLAKLSTRTWLLNTSRGPVVDNTALRVALRSNSIAGAVLDVWEGEPTNLDSELIRLTEVATPHIAGYSLEGKANATSQIIRALARHFSIASLSEWAVPTEALTPPPLAKIQLPPGACDEACLHSLVQRCYDIRSDDEDLRQDPSSFETLRSRYVYRREFSAYQVDASSLPSPSITKKVKGLGFQLSI